MDFLIICPLSTVINGFNGLCKETLQCIKNVIYVTSPVDTVYLGTWTQRKNLFWRRILVPGFLGARCSILGVGSQVPPGP